MTWARFGDTSAGYPKLMAAVRFGGGMYTVCALRGFITACATESAAHTTDYIVGYGTAVREAGDQADTLLQMATELGLFEVFRTDDTGRAIEWKIIEDPEFIHLRRKDELEWDRQRGRDSSNTELTSRVRLRDGDACRYCALAVNWSDRRGARAATYDHRNPGHPATYDTYYVSCKSCNSKRKNNPEADAQYPPLPAPAAPLYGPSTAQFILDHLGIEVAPTSAPQRPGNQPGTAPQRPALPAAPAHPSDPASSRITPRRDPALRAPRTDVPAASQAPAADDLADPQGPVSGLPGSGRAGPGPGSAGLGGDGSGSAGGGRRGRRGRGRRSR